MSGWGGGGGSSCVYLTVLHTKHSVEVRFCRLTEGRRGLTSDQSSWTVEILFVVWIKSQKWKSWLKRFELFCFYVNNSAWSKWLPSHHSVRTVHAVIFKRVILRIVESQIYWPAPPPSYLVEHESLLRLPRDASSALPSSYGNGRWRAQWVSSLWKFERIFFLSEYKTHLRKVFKLSTRSTTYFIRQYMVDCLLFYTFHNLAKYVPRTCLVTYGKVVPFLKSVTVRR